MDEQFDPIDPMNEQPNDQRDREDRHDIVSADRPRDAAPGVKQAPQDMPPMNPPADTPGASVNRQDEEMVRAQRAQRPQRNATDMVDRDPPTEIRLNPDDASVEAGDARRGADATPTRTAGRQGPGDAQSIPLLSADIAGPFLTRWGEMQAEFVDNPHRVVEQADSLVAEVMQQIAETMAQERTGLERQWAAGDAVSTEDLRLALQRYRSFFQRLLSV